MIEGILPSLFAALLLQPLHLPGFARKSKPAFRTCLPRDDADIRRYGRDARSRPGRISRRLPACASPDTKTMVP